jgi:TatD DNase family protein
MLVDSHCHLNYPGLKEDETGVIARAHAAGVGAMLTINTGLAQYVEVRDIAARHDGIYCTVGVHPHEAASDHATVETLLACAADPKTVGIGETGLDYYYEHSPRQEQQESFRRHIAAARKARLPVVVHARDADEDSARILREEMEKGAFEAVIHCFTSSMKFAREALDMGFYISFSGIITFKNAADLREVAKIVPDDRLLIETDAPFLAPVPHRGKTNEPAFVAHVANTVAEVRGVPVSRLAEQTTANFFRLFAKARFPAQQE